MEDIKNKERQRILEELWKKHEKDAITDDEGTYVNLKNFNLQDHNLTMEDFKAPGNLSLSPTNNRREGYFLQGSPGGKFRLFKGR